MFENTLEISSIFNKKIPSEYVFYGFSQPAPTNKLSGRNNYYWIVTIYLFHISSSKPKNIFSFLYIDAFYAP